MPDVDRRHEMTDVWWVEGATENPDTQGFSTIDEHNPPV